jgi:hypothetical protein
MTRSIHLEWTSPFALLPGSGLLAIRDVEGWIRAKTGFDPRCLAILMFGYSSVDVSFGFSVEDLSMNHHLSGRRNWGRFVPQRNLKTRGEAKEEQG